MPTAMSMIWDALRPMLSRFEGLMKALLGVTSPNTMIMPMTTMPIQNADEPRIWATMPVASSGPKRVRQVRWIDLGGHSTTSSPSIRPMTSVSFRDEAGRSATTMP